MSRKALLFSLSVTALAGAALPACGGGDAAPVAAPAPAPAAPAPVPPPATPPGGTPTPVPPVTPPAPPPPSPTPPPVATCPSPSPATTPAPFEISVASPPPITSSGVVPKLTSFATGLSQPWGMAFLPDGRLLVTQKPGSVVVVSADGKTLSAPLAGTPAVDSASQGGMLDVALDPAFDLLKNRVIYLAYSEPGGGGTNGTAVGRAELNEALTAVTSWKVIFQQTPKKVSQGHYGSRIVFRCDGTMFVTLGERQMPIDPTNEAQSLTSQLGKVVRINTDGSIPADNPYATDASTVKRAIWSYGHRNPQAAAIHPTTGDLWVTEHGPQGGDEVNLALPMRNFGWPTVSYGCNYGDTIGTACRIGGGTHNAPFTPPLAFWYPISTAPGGATFYTGDKFPEWRGSFFVGGLAGKTLYRLVLNGNSVVGQEPFFAGQHEIRDLRQGPDGWIYLISRNTNQILRIER